MNVNEEAWREFVFAYDIEVPKEAIDDELSYIELQMRHNMQYDRMAGGDMHLFPGRELREQEAALYEAALFEAKEPRVLKAIIAEQNFEVTAEELEEEAAAMAERQNSTVEDLKRFFGDDLAMLKRDVLETKARNWACARKE